MALFNSIPEYIAALKEKRRQIIEQRRAAALRIGIEAIALIRLRIQNTGKNADNELFTGYSTSDILVGSSSFDNQNNAKKIFGKRKNKQAKWVTLPSGARLQVLSGGYKKLRELDGYQTNHVDFFRTGSFWNSLFAQIDTEDNAKTIIIIKARDEGNQAKLNGFAEKRGNILLLSSEEEELLNEVSAQRIIEIFE